MHCDYIERENDEMCPNTYGKRQNQKLRNHETEQKHNRKQVKRLGT